MRKNTKKQKLKKIKKIKPTIYDAAVFDVLHALANFSDKELADKSGLCRVTVRNLRNGPKYGGTRFPRHITFTRLLEVAGKTYVIRDIGSNV